jgi:hypothetical protein
MNNNAKVQKFSQSAKDKICVLAWLSAKGDQGAAATFTVPPRLQRIGLHGCAKKSRPYLAQLRRKNSVGL